MKRIVSWLAGRTWGRVALIPLAFWVNAYRWLKYLIGRGVELADLNRLKDFWGWLSPRMEVYWKGVITPGDDGWSHVLSNVLVEWCRLDAQRAAKAGSFLIFATALLFLGLGVILGLCL